MRLQPSAPLRPQHLASCLLLAMLSCSMPQGARLGSEIQAYPAGVIVGANMQSALTDHDVLITRIAANLTDRQDFGEHDLEEGNGFGVGFGWRRYQQPNHSGWLYGARFDLWNLEIDWRDGSGASKRSGTTDVLVLQPTIEGGYAWRLGGPWSLDFSAGFGAEINLDEDGESVGDGAIFLMGLTFLFDG